LVSKLLSDKTDHGASLNGKVAMVVKCVTNQATFSL